MHETGGILCSVAAPPTILGSALDLMKVSGMVAMLAFLVTLNGLVCCVVFTLCHSIAVLVTIRDPDCIRVLQARVKAKRARTFYPVRGNRYVP